MKKGIITLLSLFFLVCNAIAAEKKDTLMAIYGGVFDSFTGAAVKANVYLATDSVDFSIQGITDNKVDSVVLTSLRIGMVQRNSVWLHQRRRKVMECQGNFVFLPCPEMVMGETCIEGYSNL